MMTASLDKSESSGFQPFPRSEFEQSIPARFEKVVAQFPNQIALETPQKVLTYTEFNQQINRLARAILSIRSSQEESIAILLEQGISFLTAMFSVLKTGNIYVPLDPMFPKTRSVGILEDSQATAIITNSKNLELALEMVSPDCQIINIDDLTLDLFSDDNLNLDISPDTIAYIIYTSGSTGKPKGVFQNHRNVLHNCMNQINSFKMGPHDRMTLLHSCSVMGAVRVIYNGLMSGVSLYPFDVKADGLNRLYNWLIEKEITVYHSVATLFRHLMLSLDGTGYFPAMRLIILGGEASTKKDFQLYQQYFPDTCQFGTGLGSTEAGTIRVRLLDKTSTVPNGALPPGYAVDDMTLLLLDEKGQEVPEGTMGEISVRSEYLALGYWKRPDLNQKSFLLINNSRERLFKTGDLGCLEPDGCLVHLGRKDFQVKVRGYRVELAEIEVAILDSGLIKEAVVVGRPHADGEIRLCAYYVPKDPASFNVLTLQEFLTKRLPNYMVPTYFTLLDAIPLTANGKINRLALPEPEKLTTRSPKDHLAPQTPIQEQLVKIWQDILNVENLGIRDNFFDLGGTSILAVRLVAKIEKQFNQPVSIAMLFQAPTIEKLSAAIDGETIHSSIALIQSSTGSKLPFFFINSTGQLRSLVTHLNNDLPVYGLNIFGLTELFYHKLDRLRIEEIAEYFVKDILAVQPNGCKRLCTFCGDSYLTFEIAQQLIEKKHQVEFVGLIDGLLQPYDPSFQHRLATFKDMGKDYLVHKYTNFVKQFAAKRDRQKVKGKLLRNLSSSSSMSQGSQGDRQMSQIQKNRDFYQAYVKAKRSYTPRHYDAKVHLLLSQEWQFADLSWLQRTVSEKLTVQVIKGLHNYLFETPYVEELAKTLENCLDKPTGYSTST